MAVRDISVNNHKFQIYYDIINPTATKDIVFLHGWGSSKDIMKKAFGDLFIHFRHIYIDMPGFGKSPNSEVLTTEDYAKIMEKLLQELKSDKMLIVGHSFGGKVSTLLEPKHLVLLSSAGIPQAKSSKVKMKIRLFKLLKPFGFSFFYRFFVTKDAKGMPKNMYETLKNVVDEDFAAVFANFQNRAFIFWGKEDTATPLIAGEKISSLITNNLFTPMSGNHFFFMENAQEIEKIILEKI